MAKTTMDFGVHACVRAWCVCVHMTYLLLGGRRLEVVRDSKAMDSSHDGTSCFDSTSRSSRLRMMFLFFSLKKDVARPDKQQQPLNTQAHTSFLSWDIRACTVTYAQ